MLKAQELELVEVKDKLVVMIGEEFDHHLADQLKKSLKAKGIEPLGIIMIPHLHNIVSATKQETIDAFKEFIRKLEAM